MTALSDLLADTAGLRSKVAEAEGLEQLAVDRSAFSESAQHSHCLEDLGYLTSSADRGEAMLELKHSKVQS